MNEDRMTQLFKMGLRFNGQSFIGVDENKDINFHHTELICDSDEQWNTKITKVSNELKRRNENKI